MLINVDERIIMKLLLCAFFVIASIEIQAKWASLEDAPIKSSCVKEINISADGKIKEI